MNNKVLSIISYLGILGWLISFLVNKNETDELRKYHLKQSFGMAILGIVLSVIVSYLPAGSPITGILSLVFLILMIYGIINAATEVKKPLPLIGKQFEDRFSFVS